MSLDLTKPIRTISGQSVDILRVLDRPLGNGDSIVGLVLYTEGASLESWKIDGTFHAKNGASTLDLVNV